MAVIGRFSAVTGRFIAVIGRFVDPGKNFL